MSEGIPPYANEIHSLIEQLSEEAKRQEILDLEPKEGKNKVKALVFCDAGKNRSLMIADQLKKRGYEANNYGTGNSNPFEPSAIENSGFQVIVFADETVEENFYKILEATGHTESPLLKLPTRTLDIKESNGIRGYRNSTNPFNKQKEVEKVVGETNQKLENLGFVNKNAEKIESLVNEMELEEREYA
ncbi:MAG: hypothetical protein ACOZAO_05520 [Patescibacteria group bacterium]